MQAQLQFKCTRGLTWPDLSINHCVSVEDKDVTDVEKTQLVTCDLLSNSIVVVRQNKTAQDTITENETIVRDQTVTLERLWVDDILLDLDLVLSLSCFKNDFPEGYIEYCKQHSIESAPVESHWHTWYFNGVWTWNIEQPFWPWYSNQRKEKQSRYHSKKDLELYLGTSGHQHENLLNKLKGLLNHV